MCYRLSSSYIDYVRDNLTKEERTALTNLRKDFSIIIKPENKGPAFGVILNTTDYVSEAEEELSNLSIYKPIKEDIN